MTVLEAVEPVFEGVGGVKTAVPGLLGGFAEGTGYGESALAGLKDRLDSGEASQGTAFTRIVVRGGGNGVHASALCPSVRRVPETGCVGRLLWKNLSVVHRAERDPSRTRRLVALVTPEQADPKGRNQLAGDSG